MWANRTLFLLSILFLVGGFVAATYYTEVIKFAHETFDGSEQFAYDRETLDDYNEQRVLSYMKERYRRKEIVLTPYVQGSLAFSCIGALGLIIWAYQTKVEKKIDHD